MLKQNKIQILKLQRVLRYKLGEIRNRGTEMWNRLTGVRGEDGGGDWMKNGEAIG